MHKGLLYAIGTASAALSLYIAANLFTPRTGGDLIRVTDEAFQRNAFYQAAKREFPEWYRQYLKKAVRRLDRGAGAGELADFARAQMSAFVALQARHATRAAIDCVDKRSDPARSTNAGRVETGESPGGIRG